MELREELFKNPPVEFRSVPFWSWNDRLEREELIRQLQSFKEQGIGGGFMHSRVGLITPYLSKEWMELVRACAEWAEANGMTVWLYDEDSYPSGFAGGIVPAMDDDFRQKGLEMRISENPDEASEPEVIAVFAAKMEGDRPVDPLPIPKEEAARRVEDGYKLLIFSVITAPRSSWFNGETYIDTCNPRAVRAFIEVTHEAYLREVGELFGRSIPGIFTDEPQFAPANRGKGPTLPWTSGFERIFREAKGYDLLRHLPSLFFRIGDWRRVRFDYWETMTRRFLSSFCRQVYLWCEEHNLKLTGHYWEHSFPSPTMTGATMPVYEFMHYPGIDCLFNEYEHPSRIQFGNVVMCKEVSSVAEQLGKERVLSETYGGSGWNLTFADQKRIGDWEFVLGVNFLNQHLSLYSLKGCRKRDYPPSFLDHQPWWGEYRHLADYFARLSYALSRGVRRAELLVLHPACSTWVLYNPVGDNSELNELASRFRALSKRLCELRIDFDYGDELLMERHAWAEGGRLKIGRCEYRVVLLPSVPLIKFSTLRLLEEFVRTGGKLIVLGEPPELVEGVESDELRELMESEGVVRMPFDLELIAEELPKLVGPVLEIRDENGGTAPTVYCQRRRLEEGDLYFICNVSDERGYKAEVRVEGEGELEVWDPFTGEIASVPVEREEGAVKARIDLPPIGSCLLLMRKGKRGAELPVKKLSKEVQPIRRLEGWRAKPLNENALTLDYVRFRIGGGEWSERMPVLRAYRLIRSHFNLPANENNRDVQFWKQYQELKAFDEVVEVKYEFELDMDPEGRRWWVAMEIPEMFEIKLNGEPIPSEASGHWIDHSFRMLEITDRVRRGLNELLISCRYKQDIEIEAAYLVGDFAVVTDDGVNFRVCEPRELGFGDWTGMGYPFYAGAMRYETGFELEEVEGVWLRLEWRGVVARVFVNGERAGLVAFPPYEINISPHLRPGENEVAVEVINSLRNLLGPHHNRALSEGFVHPGAFTDESNWTDEYRFVPCGLMGAELLREVR